MLDDTMQQLQRMRRRQEQLRQQGPWSSRSPRVRRRRKGWGAVVAAEGRRGRTGEAAGDASKAAQARGAASFQAEGKHAPRDARARGDDELAGRDSEEDKDASEAAVRGEGRTPPEGFAAAARRRAEGKSGAEERAEGKHGQRARAADSRGSAAEGKVRQEGEREGKAGSAAARESKSKAEGKDGADEHGRGATRARKVGHAHKVA